MTNQSIVVDLRLSSKRVVGKPVKLPTVLACSGSDSSGGAGIEADIKSITAFGCYALTAITSLTAQNTKGVTSIENTDPKFFEEILEANFEDIEIDVVKTGLLNPESSRLLLKFLDKYHKGKPFVLDPVLVATSGSMLADQHELGFTIDSHFKKATIITPNFEEACVIYSYLKKLKTVDELGEIETLEDLKGMAKFIQQTTHCNSVLLKGGHIPWNRNEQLVKKKGGDPAYIADILYQGHLDKFTVIKTDYLTSSGTHGSGCTIAASIAANIARSLKIEDAVISSIRYVHQAIFGADETLGQGKGPLNHVFHISPPINGTSAENNFLPFYPGHFLDYLLEHPLVSPIWKNYINHPFLENVATNKLAKNRFIHYICQDYVYLASYARVHGLAAGVAPDIESIKAEAHIIDSIMEEMHRHKDVLNSRGIVKLDELRPSKACKQYSDYLLNIAKTSDWVAIKIALAPCIFGYYYAAIYARSFIKDEADVDEEFLNWINTYTGDWYKDAVDEARQSLESHMQAVSPIQLAELVKIFADVCQLEVNFWTSPMELPEQDL
ncbi:hypothetical protein LJB42_003862 [Komagataella kurtzmanii]|nr:hypothetical protein LJB42_003862 [Komagataella kurtzmanii]